jgi:urea transport system substrate-binding protein
LNKTILSLVILGLISIAVSYALLNAEDEMNTNTANVPVNVPVIGVSTINADNPIKIGVLHSLSGTMAISETPVVDSTILAIEEINQRGGLLGRKLVPVVVDGRSDWDAFAAEAERLIVEEKVDVVFGGWTSASRKTMKPVFEKYDHLLFYPVQYEGLEQSPNIVYTGAAPNQQVLPAIDWAFVNIGSKFFLVGSDYVFPRSANEIIKEKVAELGGEIVGEEYKLLGDNNFDDVVQKIIETKPDVILNTINGDSNLSFFHELRQKGITPQQIPTISFSISENEITHLGTEDMEGDYASWNYFQSISSRDNEKFVNSFKKKFGPHRVTDDPMEAAYVGVYLYAKAVEEAETTDLALVKEKLRGMTLSAPEGIVGLDSENQHLRKVVRIGQITHDGQFKIISSSEEPIDPIPYPKYRTVSEWNEFLDDLYVSWNNKWANEAS